MHVHGSWVTLQALQRMERTLVWLWVKSSAWGGAGERNVRQADLSTLSCEDTGFSSAAASHRLPAAVATLATPQEELLLPPGSVPLAVLPSPVPRCRQAGRWHPSGGAVKTQGGRRGSSLLYAVRRAVREVNAGAEGRSLWVSPVPGT